MWANTPPDGGIIVLGIENDGAFSGCSSLSQGELNAREKAGYSYCPDAHYETKRIGVTNAQGGQDFVLLIRVHYREDKAVRVVSGNGFNRIGDQKHKLSEA